MIRFLYNLLLGVWFSLCRTAHRIRSALWLGGLATLLGFLSGCSGIYYRMGHGLSDPQILLGYDTSQSAKIFDTDNNLIGDYAIERTGNFSIDQLPPHVIHAFLSAEDKLFYEHDGVDLASLFGAGLGNVSRAQRGRRLAGASTLTMQVSKNLLLGNFRGLERKVGEVIQSLTLEKIADKDAILDIYLQDVFFGEQSKGIAAAAHVYFAKSPTDLTVAEAAVLAALPKSPSQFNPYAFPEASKQRRDWIIGQMQNNGYIDAATAQAAINSPLNLKRGEFDRTIDHPYFTDEVRRSFDRFLQAGGFAQSGYRVQASLDSGAQALADASLRQGLIAYDRRYGWRGALGHIRDFVPNRPIGAIDFQGFEDRVRALNTPRPAFVTSKVTSAFSLNPAHEIAFRALQKPSGLHDWDMALVTSIRRTQADIRLQNGQVGQIDLNDLGWARPLGPNNRRGARPRRVSNVLGVGDLIAVSGGDGDSYNLQQIPFVNGALVAMEPDTGRVIAISGGWDYGQSNFNRGTQAQRQPGSTFKPLVYLSALQAGLNPNTPVSDDRIKLRLRNGDFFEPRNVDGAYAYQRPLYEGLEKSRNLMTLHLMNHVGHDLVAQYAELTHMNAKLPNDFAAALGTTETMILRMATAYASIANGGYFVRPRFVDTVTDRFGRVVFDANEDACYRQECLDLRWFGRPLGLDKDATFSIADPRSIWQLTSMLRGVTQRGTGRRVGARLPFAIAGKTGTTNDVKDAWFVGFTPKLVVVAYVGFDTPRSLGRGEQGSSIAAPIVADFFMDIDPKYRASFRKPPNIGTKTGVDSSGLIDVSLEFEARIEGFEDQNLATKIPDPTLANQGSETGEPTRKGATAAADGGGFDGVF